MFHNYIKNHWLTNALILYKRDYYNKVLIKKKVKLSGELYSFYEIIFLDYSKNNLC